MVQVLDVDMDLAVMETNNIYSKLKTLTRRTPRELIALCSGINTASSISGFLHQDAWEYFLDCSNAL